MKIFSAAQIKQWDAATMANEPIASVDLMERAAGKCTEWILQHYTNIVHFHIFCGKGNNGGDGLAIARMLLQKGYIATTYILEFGHKGSEDFQINLERLHEITTHIHFLQSADFFPSIEHPDELIIDALFGTGLNKPLTGISAALVAHINTLSVPVLSIDLPSGLFADHTSVGNLVVHASHTLSFQSYKLSFLLPENEKYCGEIHLLPIGLDRQFEKETTAAFEYTDAEAIRKIYRPRSPFAHKGNFGHAAIIAGSYGMMGASLLSTLACLRSGAGKVTCYVPACGYNIMQTGAPEAMCKVCGDEYISDADGLQFFSSIGIGPGLGNIASHIVLLNKVFTAFQKPMAVDADALNVISTEPSLLSLIPQHSILTPHPKEFERLFGTASNDFDRIALATAQAKKYQIYIILKGHYTFIAAPNGKGFFNSTGNAGMATGGSGDVLTGILTGLMAQGYSPEAACVLGVYLHGLAGDMAARAISQEAMIAGDIIAFLGKAYQAINGVSHS
ncbi:MAG: NAD(P)H-hydrate dehydratase [Bacteroidetes bacterium]|nr:NAD(P)H-hydrate dehydratase [Bacteroidota bacterium]